MDYEQRNDKLFTFYLHYSTYRILWWITRVFLRHRFNPFECPLFLQLGNRMQLNENEWIWMNGIYYIVSMCWHFDELLNTCCFMQKWHCTDGKPDKAQHFRTIDLYSIKNLWRIWWTDYRTSMIIDVIPFHFDELCKHVVYRSCVCAYANLSRLKFDNTHHRMINMFTFAYTDDSFISLSICIHSKSKNFACAWVRSIFLFAHAYPILVYTIDKSIFNWTVCLPHFDSDVFVCMYAQMFSSHLKTTN